MTQTQTALTVEDPQTLRIRQLNNILRMFRLGGQTLMTSGVAALPVDTQKRILREVKAFSDFTPDNDPYGEHDFGAIAVDGHKVFWKIDYYALDMRHGSEDPADPAVTRRILTILLASEY